MPDGLIILTEVLRLDLLQPMVVFFHSCPQRHARHVVTPFIGLQIVLVGFVVLTDALEKLFRHGE